MSLIDTIYATYQRYRYRRNGATYLPLVSYIGVNADYDIKEIVSHFSLDTVIYFGNLTPSSIVSEYSPGTFAYDVDTNDPYRWLVSYLQSHKRDQQSTMIVIDEYLDKVVEAKFIALCNAYSVKLLIRQPIIK